MGNYMLNAESWQKLSIEQLVDSQLDPAKFFLENSEQINLLETKKRVFNIIDSVITTLNDVTDGVKKVHEAFETNKKDGKQLSEDQNKLSKTIGDASEDENVRRNFKKAVSNSEISTKSVSLYNLKFINSTCGKLIAIATTV